MNITQGTIETVLVTVTDRTGQLTALDNLSARFTVKDHTGAVWMNNVAAANDGMTAKCLVDTTHPFLWPSGVYNLYLSFDTSPETPVLGPLEFTVNP